MKYRSTCTLILTMTAVLSLMAILPLNAQPNPFLTTEQNGEKIEGNEQMEEDFLLSREYANPGFYSKITAPFFNSSFMRNVRKLQKEVQAKVSFYISAYKDQGISGAFSFMMLAFLYGFLHVLGPGHRKIFLFTYFISKPARWKQGMLVGAMTAVLHAFSAIFFIGGLYLLAEKTLLSRFNNLMPVIEKIAYGLIVLIGLKLFFSHIRSSVKGHCHCHHHGKGEYTPDTLMFVLAAGLVPCPGTVAIMVFSIAMAAPMLGVLAVISMSLGMALILTFIPPAAIFIQNRIEPLLARWNPHVGEKIHSAMEISASLALIFFGLLFML